MRVIPIFADPIIGGTFLSWTIHYLAGHTEYFNAVDNEWVALPEDPLSGINSHNFKANQANTYEDVDLFLNRLTGTPTGDFHTLYFHRFGSDVHQDSEKFNALIKSFSGNKSIVLYRNYHEFLYDNTTRKRADRYALTSDPTRNVDTHEEFFDDYINNFFPDSKAKWFDLGLTDIWDKREFLALNLRPFEGLSILNNIDPDHEYYWIQGSDMWTNFDQLSVFELFKYLNINIDIDRLGTWKEKYNTWKSFHKYHVAFIQYFDTTIENIVSGRTMDLARFDLDILQESVIQHILIYKHNLNLKTYNLLKFKNTKQLHDLLEPNIHLIQE